MISVLLGETDSEYYKKVQFINSENTIIGMVNISMENQKLLAHVKQNKQGDWIIHSLEEHLNCVAKMATEFAGIFGLGKLSTIQSLVHDIGKASNSFQQRIAGKSGYDPDAHVKTVDHATSGGQFVVEKYGDAGIPLAYSIMGHHGGLPNGIDEHQSCLSQRLKKNIPDYEMNLDELPLPNEINISNYLTKKSNSKIKMHFLIRMLYSTLVDADFLDTESFMHPEKNRLRNNSSSIDELIRFLDEDISSYTDYTGINKVRADILKWCRAAAKMTQGLFSLTVPTGGGKTKSSIAFALDHCLKYDLRRIIYVIPYTSIISQNAAVFKNIFGSDNVLEHHSNIEPEKEDFRNRLLCENWNAPIVVTTNIQFFESFYNNRSSSCRKLHNVADSVIIFDEAQMLPPEFMKPCLEVIKELVENYGCSAVLCTATQPALNNKKYLKKQALDNVREIIPDPEKLYETVRRVNIEYIPNSLTYDELVRQVAEYEKVLVIVNTRKDAREVFNRLLTMTDAVEEIFHLSTFMCPKHRNNILSEIRIRLLEGQNCRVVSTQLIEAGVDIDFPVVFRAVAGLDSIAQAAGRCNREGRMNRGKVFVFKGETLPPPGHLRQSAESGEKAIIQFSEDPLCLDALDYYFNDFYWKRSNTHGMDSRDIVERLNNCGIKQIPFKDIARDFNIINQKTTSVLIPFDKEGEEVTEKLKNPYYFPDHDDYRTAQRISIQVLDKVLNILVGMGAVFDARGDGQFFILSNTDIYSKYTGLSIDDPQFIESEKLVL